MKRATIKYNRWVYDGLYMTREHTEGAAREKRQREATEREGKREHQHHPEAPAVLWDRSHLT